MTLLDLLVKAGAVLTLDFEARGQPGPQADGRAWPASVTVSIRADQFRMSSHDLTAYATLPNGKYRAIVFLVPAEETPK